MKGLNENLSSILILLSSAFTIPAVGFLIISESSFNLLVFLLSSLLSAAILVLIMALFDLMKEGEEESIINKSPSELVPESDRFPEDWEMVEEEKLPSEEVEWEEVAGKEPSAWGFLEGFVKVFEKNSKRIAFCLVKFSSTSKAEDAFLGISKDQEDISYPTNLKNNSTGLYSRENKIDGTLFKVKNFLSLTIVGSQEEKTEKKESLPYAIHSKKILTSR